MLVEKIEEYLDGTLDSAGRQEVEALVASDATAARILTHCKAQRALRSAAYATYMPTKHEASALAAQVMAEAHAPAPAGRIGPWLWRSVAAAAVIAIVASVGFGAYKAGKSDGVASVAKGGSSTNAQPQVITKTVYEVTSVDALGETSVRDFASVEDRDSYIKDLDHSGGSVVEVAAIALPGQM